MSIIDKLNADPERYKDASGEWLPTKSIATLLTSTSQVPNPEEAKHVPATDEYKCRMLRDAIPADLLATFSDGAIRDLMLAIRESRLNDIRTWVKIGLARKKISSAAAQQILGLIDNGTMADPSHQTTITKQPALPTVSHAEIDAALGRKEDEQ